MAGALFTVECRYRLLLGVAKHGRRFDIDSILFRFEEYSPGKPWLQVFGAIPEVCLGGTHMGCIGHRIFVASGQPVNIVGKNLALVVCKSVIHKNRNKL